MNLSSPQPIRTLDKNIAQRLHTGQVIVDVESIVKELIENSLDAHASNVDILLVDNGLTEIQVKDDGCGIPEKDRTTMAKLYTTSKIAHYNDLKYLKTFGFRGEALNAICETASDLHIITKTAQDRIARQYQIDAKGDICDEKHTACISTSGTIVDVFGAFSKLPVRRQIAKNGNAGIAKNVQALVFKYCLSHPLVRFSIRHGVDGSLNCSSQWIKPPALSVIDSALYLYKPGVAPKLRYMRHINDSVTLECVLPKIDETPRSISRRNNLFIYVNRRPINHVASELKEIAIMYRKYYCEAVSVKEREYSTLNPFFYLDIQLCPDQYEVNFDPRKSVILLHKKERILSAFEELMIMAYGSLIGEERLDNQLKRKSMAPAESRIAQNIPKTVTNDFDDHANNDLAFIGKSTDSREDNPAIPVYELTRNPGDPTTPSDGVWKFTMYSEGSSDEDDDEDRVQERKMRTYEEYTAPAPQQPTILSWLKNSACNGTSAVVQSQTKVDFSPKPPQVRKLGQFMPNDMEWQLEELHSGSQQSPNEKGTKPSNVVIHSPMLTLPAASQSAVPNGQVRDDQRMPVCPYPRKAPVLSGKPACYGIESSPFSGRHIVPQKRNRHCGKVPTSENSRRPPHVKVQPTAKNIPSKPRDRKNTTSMNARENTQRDREEYLTRTANTEEKVVYSNDRVRSTFINRQRRSGAMKHLSLNDYFGTTAGMGSVACSYTLLNLVDISRDLVIYSSGYYDTVYYGKVVQEIGVVDLPSAHRNYMVHRYMNEHELIANMGLDPPIQIAITEELSYIISSLENETRIALDVIGQKKHYHYVTDRRIKANGFEIRWIGKQHRIIEILSVCELNDHTPPGATEFLELLNLIGRQRRLSNQTRLGLACLRPRRMIRYLHQIANDALPHRATDAEAVELAILCEPAMETKIVRKLYPVRAIQ